MMIRLHKNEEGAAAVEFSIVALIFIIFIVGIIEVGRGFHLRNQLVYSLDRALRLTYLNQAISDEALKAAVQQNFYGAHSSLISTSIATQSLDGRNYRLITATMPFKLFVPAISSSTITLSVKRLVPA